MTLVYESALAPSSGSPNLRDVVEEKPQLEITVVFTSFEATVQALKEAGLLAGQLEATITLLVPQVVPWPLQLTCPPVLVDFNEARFRVIASRTGVPTNVRIYFCRDRFETVLRVVPHGSIVMVGIRKRFWPTADRRLAWALRRRGHQVILTEMED